MLKNNHKIWLDGKIVDFKDANVSILSHSLHYGSSVFEGIRSYETKNKKISIFRLKEHIDRLFNSAKFLSMNIPFSKKEIEDACFKVLKLNGLKSAYIRPIVFYDESSMGLDYTKNKVRISVIAFAWGKYLKNEVRGTIVSIRRISEYSLNVEAKVGGHYVNSTLATLEAKQKGFDEAILLDHSGYIAEGPGENLFFIFKKNLYTPKIGKILNGITRKSIIEIAKDLGYNVIEKDITPFELSDFEGAFMCGTAAEFTPIKEIGNIKFSTKKGADIKKEFEKVLIAENKKYLSWNYIK